MTRDTRLMWGITLVTVPTIVFGGLTVLGVISSGRYGLPGPPDLTLMQTAFYRAGHAHAAAIVHEHDVHFMTRGGPRREGGVAGDPLRRP